MIDYIWIGLIFLVLALLIWALAPIWIVKRFSITEPRERADVEDNYRKTVGQAIGAVALIVTFAWTFYKDREAIELSREQLRSQARQFVNQQFISAAGLLKEGSVSTRIAGLHALEQIAGDKPPPDSKNQYLMPVIRALMGFVRNPVDPKADGQPIAADVQSAITILSHLNEEGLTVVDLHGGNLVQGDFTGPRNRAFIGSDFQGAILYGADLSDLDLTNGRFGGSSMSDTDAWGGAGHMPPRRIYDDARKQHTVDFESSTLIDANFDHAGMGGASLVKSCLAGASFNSTELSRVLFKGADMGRGGKCVSGRNLAYFYRVAFVDANFDDVDIGGVSFARSNLIRTDFSKAKNVDKAGFDRVCADEPPKFPPSFGLTFSACAR